MPDEDVAGPIQAAPTEGAVEALGQVDAAGDHGPVIQYVRGGDALELGLGIFERRPERTRLRPGGAQVVALSDQRGDAALGVARALHGHQQPVTALDDGAPTGGIAVVVEQDPVVGRLEVATIGHDRCHSIMRCTCSFDDL